MEDCVCIPVRISQRVECMFAWVESRRDHSNLWRVEWITPPKSNKPIDSNVLLTIQARELSPTNESFNTYSNSEVVEISHTTVKKNLSIAYAPCRDMWYLDCPDPMGKSLDQRILILVVNSQTAPRDFSWLISVLSNKITKGSLSTSNTYNCSNIIKSHSIDHWPLAMGDLLLFTTNLL